MKKTRLFVLIITMLVLASSNEAKAQRVGSTTNLERFDMRYYHFGFLLSWNTSSFYINRSFDPAATGDSLLTIENVPQAGFNLALLASFNPTKNINLRFIPGLSFQDRGLNYTFRTFEGKNETFLKRTESVWLDFPILLKMRTNRTGNFAAYALVGAKYSLDMQSQKDVNNAVAEQVIIKLQDRDYSIDVGGGFDFFLPYFKFAIEFKTAIGLPDLLIHEDTPFSNSIDKLRSRTFIVSFTFEG
ncbi:MAG: outer membrane beta-barrel protein [Flavobacteriales bacterium]